MNRRITSVTTAAVLGGAALIWIIAAMTGSGRPPAVVGIARAVEGNHPATTNPAADSALTAEFAILQTHNAFSRGDAAGHGPHGGPEAVLVFKGVVQADGACTAFIENQAAKQVTQAAVGDAVARGRIKSIDLDAIVYEVAGGSRRIEIGQNLNGEVVAPPATQPSQASGSQDAQTPP